MKKQIKFTRFMIAGIRYSESYCPACGTPGYNGFCHNCGWPS